MQAGQLRHRVTIERPAGNADQYGEPEAGWVEVATVWAFVRPLRAGEVIRAAQPGMETAYVVKMRYTSLLTPDCRLAWQGNHLHVVGITDVNGRGVELEVLANEREVPSGAG